MPLSLRTPYHGGVARPRSGVYRKCCTFRQFGYTRRSGMVALTNTHIQGRPLFQLFEFEALSGYRGLVVFIPVIVFVLCSLRFEWF